MLILNKKERVSLLQDEVHSFGKRVSDLKLNKALMKTIYVNCLNSIHLKQDFKTVL